MFRVLRLLTFDILLTPLTLVGPSLFRPLVPCLACPEASTYAASGHRPSGGSSQWSDSPSTTIDLHTRTCRRPAPTATSGRWGRSRCVEVSSGGSSRRCGTDGDGAESGSPARDGAFCQTQRQKSGSALDVCELVACACSKDAPTLLPLSQFQTGLWFLVFPFQGCLTRPVFAGRGFARSPRIGRSDLGGLGGSERAGSVEPHQLHAVVHMEIHKLHPHATCAASALSPHFWSHGWPKMHDLNAIQSDTWREGMTCGSSSAASSKTFLLAGSAATSFPSSIYLKTIHAWNISCKSCIHTFAPLDCCTIMCTFVESSWKWKPC